MLKKLRARRSALRAAIDTILATPTEDNRSLTAEETSELTTKRTELREVEDLIDLYEELADDDAADEARGGAGQVDGAAGIEIRAGDTLDPGGAVRELVGAAAGRAAATDTGQAVVKSNPLTYDRRNKQRSYLWDLARFKMGVDDTGESAERLAAHAAEMRVEMPRLEARLFGTLDNPKVSEIRDDAAAKRVVQYPIDYERRDLARVDGAGGEFVPPMWMVEDYVNLARAGRVSANLARQIPLPGGTDSINIPRVATGASTAPQTADNAAVSETDLSTNSVSAPVRTIAGQQDIALQLLEQSPIAFDEVTFEDLANDHAEVLDTQVLNGSAGSGQMRGILQIVGVDTTTYTDGSPTVPELYPKLADAANQIATTRYRMPEVIKMHPRRWFWMLAALDSQSRPLVVPSTQGPNNALATAEQTMAEGFVGRIMGIAVWLDPNIPTGLGDGANEDRVIFDRPSEQYLFEGPVRTRVLPEVGSGTLTVRLQLYSYAAFIPDRRVESVSIVAGTGLVAPAF